MENLNIDKVRGIMEESRRKPSSLEVYKKIIKNAIITAAKNGQGDVFVETNAELNKEERKIISEILTNNGLRIKWHNINDDDDEKIHIMWEF